MWFYIIMAVVAIVAYLLMPRPTEQHPPADNKNLSATTAGEGTTIPVVYGSRIVSGNIVWYGDLAKTPIYKNTPGSK